MKISGFQNYKIANKVLASMLAVTLTVGITPSFSFANGLDNVVEMTALDDPSTPAEQQNENEIGGPTVLWAYKNSEENCIYVGVKDDNGLDKILDKNRKERVVFKPDPVTNEELTEAVARYELEKGEQEVEGAEFVINNKKEKGTRVKIADVSLDVSRAYKNENGNVIALELQDITNGISKVTYLDGTEISGVVITDKEEDDKAYHRMNSYVIDAGTTAVKVYQKTDPNKFAIVMLELDWKAPAVERLYKNEGNTKLIIKAMDNDSGIERVLLDGKEMTIVAYSNEIFKQIETGVTKVEIYDAVGHKTELPVETCSTSPWAEIKPFIDDNGEEVEGKYILKIKAKEAGLWKVIKKTEGEADTEVKKYDEILNEEDILFPQGEQELTLEQVSNIAQFIIYDAVGNKTVVDMRNISCVIVYAHNNEDGDKIAVSLYDNNREITKLAILNNADIENVIEQFEEGNHIVRRWYETPKGTTKIKVYYKQPVATEEVPNPDPIEPAEYVLSSYEVAPTKIGNKVYSLVGISKIVYKYQEKESEAEDAPMVEKIGRTVEFKEKMPTKVEVDLTNCDSAEVYDSLNNKVVVER